MKDKLSFPAFTHDSIAGYCNGNPLYAQYKNDKKSKYIGTKQMWQELSKLGCDLEIARQALKDITKEHSAFADWVFKAVTMKSIAEKALEQIEHKE